MSTGGTTSGGSTSTGGSSIAGVGTPCPFGTECPATAPACISAGVGDATAYCSVYDCEGDSDCPSGLYCGVRRDPHAICGSNPPKGDNNTCGLTNEPCIDLAGDATTRFEGSLCMLRKACLYREQCAPCASDADCSAKPYQKCAALGGESRCARECGDSGDCLDDATCESGVCTPKAGACKATGQFCEPCLDDTDCGDASTMRACAELIGGMKGCFDFAFATPCTTDSSCPTAPGGKHGSCLDENLGVSAGDPQYHRCYLPVDTVSYAVSCW